jgi:hypothetical protein
MRAPSAVQRLRKSLTAQTAIENRIATAESQLDGTQMAVCLMFKNCAVTTQIATAKRATAAPETQSAKNARRLARLNSK